MLGQCRQWSGVWVAITKVISDLVMPFELLWWARQSLEPHPKEKLFSWVVHLSSGTRDRACPYSPWFSFPTTLRVLFFAGQWHACGATEGRMPVCCLCFLCFITFLCYDALADRQRHFQLVLPSEFCSHIPQTC